MATQDMVITMLSGSFVKDTELIGKQDPYVVFEIGQEEIFTETVKNGGVSPVWDEDYVIKSPAQSLAGELKIFVYNKHTLRPDTLIGKGVYNLRQLDRNSAETPVRVSLTDKKDRYTGELSFILKNPSYKATTTRTEKVPERTGVATGAGAGLVGAGVAGERLTDTRGVHTGEHREHHREHREHLTDMRETGYTNTTGVEGVTSYVAGTRSVPLRTEPAVCKTEPFTRVEDRPITIERKELLKEHHPVEKQYVQEVKFKGERELAEGRRQEHMGTHERVVETTAPSKPCT